MSILAEPSINGVLIAVAGWHPECKFWNPLGLGWTNSGQLLPRPKFWAAPGSGNITQLRKSPLSQTRVLPLRQMSTGPSHTVQNSENQGSLHTEYSKVFVLILSLINIELHIIGHYPIHRQKKIVNPEHLTQVTYLILVSGRSQAGSWSLNHQWELRDTTQTPHL